MDSPEGPSLLKAPARSGPRIGRKHGPSCRRGDRDARIKLRRLPRDARCVGERIPSDEQHGEACHQAPQTGLNFASVESLPRSQRVAPTPRLTTLSSKSLKTPNLQPPHDAHLLPTLPSLTRVIDHPLTGGTPPTPDPSRRLMCDPAPEMPEMSSSACRHMCC